MINSLMYAFSSFGGISSISRLVLQRQKFFKQSNILLSFLFVFSFSWSSINCSTETMSANLGEAAKVVNIPTFIIWEAAPKGGKTDITFFTSEKYRMTNHRPHTIFFNSEKNRMNNQIVSRF